MIMSREWPCKWNLTILLIKALLSHGTNATLGLVHSWSSSWYGVCLVKAICNICIYVLHFYPTLSPRNSRQTLYSYLYPLYPHNNPCCKLDWAIINDPKSPGNITTEWRSDFIFPLRSKHGLEMPQYNIGSCLFNNVAFHGNNTPRDSDLVKVIRLVIGWFTIRAWVLLAFSRLLATECVKWLIHNKICATQSSTWQACHYICSRGFTTMWLLCLAVHKW